MLGSSVLPDLLETMQIVLLRSTFASMALICAGSVESRTCSSGNPLILPKVICRTSGQRLEPPIPNRRACLKRAFFTSPAICFSASIWPSCSSVIVSQPSQLLSSVPLQSEASFCQRRATLLFFFQSSMDVATAPASGPDNLWVWRFRLTRAHLQSCPRHPEGF